MKKYIVMVTVFYFIPFSELYAQRIVPEFVKHVVTDTLNSAKKLFSIDMDNDNDYDIVAVASNTNSANSNVIWYENNGKMIFTPRIISKDFYKARAVWVADILNNGYPDIIAGGAGPAALSVFINDGSPAIGNWVKKELAIPDSSIYSIGSGDLDGDTFQDIIVTFGNIDNDNGGDNIKIFINNRDTTFSIDTLVTNYEGASSVYIDYLDNDNYLDIISAAFGDDMYGTNDDISWWSNDGLGSFSQYSLPLSSSSAAPFFVHSSDLNNDGYKDILAAIYFGDYPDNSGRISYWLNSGSGSFNNETIILNNFTYARSVHGIDLDGDGDTDIVGCADSDNIIIWMENDGFMNFSFDTLTSSFSYAYFEFPVDFDGDGDIDVVGSAQNDYEVSWFENTQNEDSLVAANDADSVAFWGGNVIMDFSAGNEGHVTAFYNAGYVPQRSDVGGGVDHIAQKGYYTLTTNKTAYTTSIDFYYDNLQEWLNIDDEEDLVICIWNKPFNQWIAAGDSQTVYPLNDFIRVFGITDELIPFSRWTMGSTTSDNSLPVTLLNFSLIPKNSSIDIQWVTASETDNLGYEIWRSFSESGAAIRIAGYDTDESLRSHNSASGANYIYRDYEVEKGMTYYYQLKQKDNDGTVKVIAEKSIEFNGILPDQFVLYQNYPNPFNQSTLISFNIPEGNAGNAAYVKLEIYSTLGQRVVTLLNKKMSAGEYEIKWDGKSESGMYLPSGNYFILMRSANKFITKKLVLLR